MSNDFINLSEIKLKNYSSIFLKNNPFPMTLVPSDTPVFTADRSKERKHYAEKLAQLINNNGGSITILKGQYGSGKSHLLHAVKNYINQNLFNYDNGALSVYIRTPGNTILNFYQEFITDVGRTQLELFAKHILSSYIDGNKNISKFIFDKKMTDPKKTLNENTDAFIDGVRRIDMFRDVLNTNFKELKNSDVLYGLLYLLVPSLSSYAWKWLWGTKLSSKELSSMQLNGNITNGREAYVIFENFVHILNEIGVKHLVLLIDEFEKLTLLSKNIRETYQDDFRHLIDDFASKILITFAITPYHWNELIKEDSALIRRLSEYELELEYFKKSEMMELIEQYLKHYRTKNFKNSDPINCKDNLYPFNNDSIDVMYDATKGASNRILRTCRESIEYIVDKNQNIVTADVMNEVLLVNNDDLPI